MGAFIGQARNLRKHSPSPEWRPRQTSAVSVITAECMCISFNVFTTIRRQGKSQ